MPPILSLGSRLRGLEQDYLRLGNTHFPVLLPHILLTHLRVESELSFVIHLHLLPVYLLYFLLNAFGREGGFGCK